MVRAVILYISIQHLSQMVSEVENASGCYLSITRRSWVWFL